MRYRNYRLFFFSREEKRKHVHVTSPDGEARFWLEPIVALAEKKKDEIGRAWDKHFKS